MKSEKEFPFTGKKRLNSRFAIIEVEADENGNPRIVLSGPGLLLTGFDIGDRIDAIFQENLVSLMRLE